MPSCPPEGGPRARRETLLSLLEAGYGEALDLLQRGDEEAVPPVLARLEAALAELRALEPGLAAAGAARGPREHERLAEVQRKHERLATLVAERVREVRALRGHAARFRRCLDGYRRSDPDAEAGGRLDGRV